MPPREPVFHVKICGVTSADDARMVAAAGADAIGLNFVPGSPRCLTSAAAREVAAAIPDDVLVVGVFAGMPAADVKRMAAEVGLDAVQLHGHLSGDGVVDPPSACGDLAPLTVIRAVRLGPDGLDAARSWIAAAAALGHAPAMAVVDAAVTAATAAGQLGGTGATVDWSRLAAAGDLGIPMAVAGGLTPGNVAEAVAASRAVAVDTASGVESAPGRKDQAKVRAFCAAAREALAPKGT
ncbi:MAG: phosphoribosylanthranilate isomerase [Planctomycetes bacterium]|nr:phosphoribosylanthranilate isomerase [Planctomycetota bacterium]